jgi:hypothetical protein
VDNDFAPADIGSRLFLRTDHIDEIRWCACGFMGRRAMTSDPVEAMGNVVALEASRLQSLRDSEVMLEALAISEAESQRSRLRDRLEAAVGLTVCVHLPGERLSGSVQAVGAEVVVIETPGVLTAVAVGSIVSIEGLPRTLRLEQEQAPRVRVTWSSVFREWAESGLIRFALSDGRCVRGWVDSVGGDHLDFRDSEGTVRTVIFSAIRKAAINR